jgi:Salt tolerance down-regulator
MPPKARKTTHPRAASIPRPSSGTSGTVQAVKSAPPPLNEKYATDKRETESKTGDTTESAGEPNSAPSINRKKQKRREKEAAKKRAADEDLTNGHVAHSHTHSHSHGHSHGRGPAKGYFTEDVDPSHPDFADVGSPEDAFYSGDEDQDYDHLASGPHNTSWLNTSKRQKSKKKQGSIPSSNAISRTSTAVTRPSFPSVSNAALRSAHRMGDSLWNPSTQAERENIKQFWLDLGEEERRSLVKIEKEAVLRKMKEQQKHSCSCSVCGRKRTAIEEELEVLYDAYYEELEQFANHDPDLTNAPQLMAPPRPTLRRALQPIPGSFSSRGRVQELGDDDEDDVDNEDECDDDEDEPYSDEDEDDLDIHGLPPGPPDFFQFGNSLTVKGVQCRSLILISLTIRRWYLDCRR